MTADQTQSCVLLPCASSEIWALPLNCLAEILSFADAGVRPPESVVWRGCEVPVLDLDRQQTVPWREQRSGAGLVAVMLGLRGEGCDYWAVALRGEGLGMKDIGVDEVEDSPDEALSRSVSAFRLQGVLYQVPDLLALQRQITARRAAA